MHKLPRVEMAALLAMISMGASGIASANAADNHTDTMEATEHQLLAAKSGKDSSCGEGSCGTDKKGMKAAKDKKAEKEKTEADKTEKQSGGAASSDANKTQK